MDVLVYFERKRNAYPGELHQREPVSWVIERID